jgi:hypothetical protein
MTKNEVDINELIQEHYVVPESVFDRKRTKTSHFLLNTVFPKGNVLNMEFFVNAFLNDDGFEHQLLRPLFVLFKFKQNDPRWYAVYKKLIEKEEYIMDYLCGTQDGKIMRMMIFQIPDKYAKDYIKFKAGQYSKFSPEYKKTFNRYTATEKGLPIESTVWRVINKSPELKKELEKFFNVPSKVSVRAYQFEPEDELWGIPQPKFENYRYKV